MRKTPTYDWDWVDSHTPFKKILEDTCELKINTYKHKTPVIAGIFTYSNHYVIKFNFPMFEEKFEVIKQRLLKTNLCRKNKEVFDWINKLECSKREVCHVIIDGCIANVSGSFEWDWCDKE